MLVVAQRGRPGDRQRLRRRAYRGRWPLDADSTADSPIPDFGDAPTAAFVDNPRRPDRASDPSGVLYILDPGTAATGTVAIAATVAGGSIPGSLTATLTVAPVPAGNVANGMAVYTTNCAICHGASGGGSPANADGATYTLENVSYPYPAPGLDTKPGNLASDPDWNAPLLAVAARSDMDNGGLVLRTPMPDWSTRLVPDNPLTTQDLLDVYAFLATQWSIG